MVNNYLKIELTEICNIKQLSGSVQLNMIPVFPHETMYKPLKAGYSTNINVFSEMNREIILANQVHVKS